MKNEWGSIYWDDTLSNEFLLKHERSCCILGLCLNQRTVQRTLVNKQTKRSLSFRDMRFVDTFTSVIIWKEVKSEALPSGSQDFRCHIRIHLFHLRLVTWLGFNAFLFLIFCDRSVSRFIHVTFETLCMCVNGFKPHLKKKVGERFLNNAFQRYRCK